MTLKKKTERRKPSGLFLVVVKNGVIGQNVLMANPNQRMFHSPYGDHSIQ